MFSNLQSWIKISSMTVALAGPFGYINLAHAEPVCIDIEGEVTTVYDFFNVIDGRINVGDVVTGRYIYESTTPDSDPRENVSTYQHNISPFGVTVNIGEFVFRTDPNNVDFLVQFLNFNMNPTLDAYGFHSYRNIFDLSVGGPAIPGMYIDHISFQLDDETGTAIDSIELPLVPPNLSDWAQSFGLQIISDNWDVYFVINSEITSALLCDDWGTNLAPVANAGPDQSVRPGDNVQLDSTGSFDDNTPTAALVYEWSLYSTPIGSDAVINDANAAMASLSTDVAGEYVVRLKVTDEQGLTSAYDEAIISTNNLAPTSNAGPDQLVISHSLVTLDGSSSTDPEADPISYLWEIASAPSGSTSSLSGNDSSEPTLIPDMEGDYVISLTVSDLLGPGTPDTVTITSTVPEDFAESEIVEVDELVETLPIDTVTSEGNQASLTDFLAQSVKAIERDDIEKAISSLERSITRADGCALRGTPDTKGRDRDWITDCEAQIEVYETLTSALEALKQSQ